jgi:hypothetical protein
MTHRVSGPLVRFGALAMLVALLSASGLEAAPIEVRFREGVTHGLLALRSTSGATLALGDLLQTPQGDRVESRMTFHFKDGSLHDETVTFSQEQVFTMVAYRLVQRGPSFPEAVDVSLDRKTARYTVRSTSKGKEDVSDGRIELPSDVYNGMIAMLLKNLSPDRSETVHFIAFTPTPRLIQVDLLVAGNQRVLVGDEARQALLYAVKPKLGRVLGFFAALLGKTPTDYACVILAKDVPAFVRCDGPLFLNGPIWRIELTTAH